MAGADEYELGLLSPEDSVALLLECAGEPGTKESSASPLMYKGESGFGDHIRKSQHNPNIMTTTFFAAVELCGHLPLVISMAGGVLESHGGVVDEGEGVYFIKLY